MDKSFPLTLGVINTRYRIVDILSLEKVRRRLFDIGFTKGSSVTIVKKSVKGEVYLISLRGFLIAIKGTEVASILVENE